MTIWMQGRAAPFAFALICSAAAIVAAWVVTQDPSLQALYAARWTARAMLVPFLIVYLARPLAQLTGAPWAKSLVKYRRQWGLAFALAMTIHLVALLINIGIYRPRSPSSLVGGGIAYAFTYVMALTSTTRAQHVLGRWWKRLHRAGLHYIALIFTISYASRIVHEDPHYHAEGWAFALVMLAAIAIRFGAWMKTRRRG